MVLEKLNIYMQKNGFETLGYAIHKNYLKMDKKPKCKTQTHKTYRKIRKKNS